MEQYRLFLDDLADSLRGLLPRPDAVRSPDDVATTQAVGEEGDQPEDGHVTTLAVGEEGDQPDDPGDRLADRFDDLEDDLGDDLDDFAIDLDDRFAHLTDRLAGLANGPTPGGGEPVATTQAVGEDGDQADPDPIDTGTSTDAQGIVAGEPYPGSDTDDWQSPDDAAVDEATDKDDSHEQVHDAEHDDHAADTAF